MVSDTIADLAHTLTVCILQDEGPPTSSKNTWVSGEIVGLKYQRRGDKFSVWMDSKDGGKFCDKCSKNHYKKNSGGCRCKRHGDMICCIKEALTKL